MNSLLSGLLYICILFVSIGLGAIYGSLVDEGAITQYIPIIFLGVIILNIGYPLACIYKKYHIGLFIYGITLVIGGLVAKYYDYSIFMERGFGIYGNFTPIMFMISGMIVCISSYAQLKKGK